MGELSVMVSVVEVVCDVSRREMDGKSGRESKVVTLPVLLGAWQTSEMGQARHRRNPSHPAL